MEKDGGVETGGGDGNEMGTVAEERKPVSMPVSS